MKNILEMIESVLGEEEMEKKTFSNEELVEIMKCVTPEEDKKIRENINSILELNDFYMADMLEGLGYAYSRMILMERGYKLKKFDL